MASGNMGKSGNILVLEAEDWASVQLPAAAQIKREPPRAKHLQQPGFEAEFDFLTVFYDAFLWKGGAEVRLIGPKYLNFAPYIHNARIWVADDAGQTPLAFRFHEKRKVAYLDIILPEPTGVAPRLMLDLGALGTFEVRPNKSGLDIFEGRRVAFTLFKYEPNHWLRDWAWFNACYHGADALVVYHNDCSDRTTAEIAAALEDIPGVEVTLVANWPFPYGPSDGGTGEWDSNFCQVGMFEQMRWRFLQNARSVLNSDIDELIVTKDHRSAFEIAEETPEQYVQFLGKWVTMEGDLPSVQKRRHVECCYIADDPLSIPVEPKWAAVPSAFGEDKRWIVHEISQSKSFQPDFADAGLRHFRQINTGWKVDRGDTSGPLVLDEQLQTAFRKVGWLF